MIEVESIEWYNLLSTGSEGNKIVLNTHHRTLISGINGSGKSTLLDAWCFNWFGKAYRNINKNQLINSINGKDCLTISIFKIDSVRYKIVRGIRPNIFEIYKDGELINQDAATKDYQKYLEQQILKVEHRSMTQVAILGSANFQPFMQLPTGARRATIEDLLDISIFSRMNTLLKERQKQLKDEYLEATTELSNAQRNVNSFTDILDVMNNKKTDQVSFKKSLIDGWRNQLAQISTQMLQVVNEKAELEKTFAETEQAVKEYLERRVKDIQIVATHESVNNKTKAYYEKNEHCDVCGQDIDAEFRSGKLIEAAGKAKEIAATRDLIANQEKQWAPKVVQVESDRQKITSYMTQLNKWAGEIQMIQTNIGNTSRELSALENRDDDIVKVQTELENAKQSVAKFQKKLASFGDESNYFTACSELLKDTGIKTKIIKKYLPIINKLINDHLQTLDFFVNFSLNESFEEKILSRHQDIFSYSSFSEGEKQKINLAVLFAWRQIAKMKNSCSTNLLVLDEVMDSSLDADGMENLMTLLEAVDPKTNVVVISHRGINETSFDRHIKFEKEQNFSIIK